MRRTGAILLLGLLAAWSPRPARGASPLLEQDLRRLCRPASLGLMAAALAGGALVHPWDDQVHGPLVHTAVLKRFLAVGNAYGSSLNVLGLSAGAWGLGWATEHPQLQATASELTRAVLLAGGMVVPLKRITNRWRPDHSDRRSFPSGHSAIALATSTALARQYGRRAGVPLYALAMLTPLARIHYRRHYLSDVVAGGLLGVAAGWAVTEPQSRVAWLPTGGADWQGIEVRLASR